MKSRSVWGAWIETRYPRRFVMGWPSRAPYGARGLKHDWLVDGEIFFGRAPYGARGLKRGWPGTPARARRRAPYGARGLKLVNLDDAISYQGSRSVWGAWIETQTPAGTHMIRLVALRMGRVD